MIDLSDLMIAIGLGSAVVLALVTLAHTVIALRLLSRSLVPGVLALSAPLPLVGSAFATPLVIASWFVVFDDKDLLDMAWDVIDSPAGPIAWGGALTLAIVPVALSAVAHLGVTPARPGLDEASNPSDGADADPPG